MIVRRSIGSPMLFAIIYTSLASAIYFSLGVVAGHALGLTPLVFLVAALFFALTAMTYVEGASLHQERGGSTVFARYAFNELVSFIAGWAVLLDYVILIAVTALLGDAVPDGLLEPARPPRRGAGAVARVHRAGRAHQHPRLRRRAARGGSGILLAGDLAAAGVHRGARPGAVLQPADDTDPIHLGSAPTWTGVIFALTITAVAFTSLESASGLAGEVAISRAGAEAPGRRARPTVVSCTSASRSSR